MNIVRIESFVIRWFDVIMSAEKISTIKIDELSSIKTPKSSEEKVPGRVDINHLLARVRDEQNKENKVNLVFFGLFASLVIIVGLILSF